MEGMIRRPDEAPRTPLQQTGPEKLFTDSNDKRTPTELGTQACLPGALYARIRTLRIAVSGSGPPMPYQRLPECVQTLYAELFEQTVHAQADAAAAGSSQGSFVSKTVKGGIYWYLQRMEGEAKRQRYL